MGVTQQNALHSSLHDNDKISSLKPSWWSHKSKSLASIRNEEWMITQKKTSQETYSSSIFIMRTGVRQKPGYRDDLVSKNSDMWFNIIVWFISKVNRCY